MVEWSLANLAAWSVQAAAVVVAGAWLPTRLRLGVPRARLLLFRLLLVACVALPLAQPWHAAPAAPAAQAPIDVPAPSPGSNASPAGPVAPAAATGAGPAHYASPRLGGVRAVGAGGPGRSGRWRCRAAGVAGAGARVACAAAALVHTPRSAGGCHRRGRAGGRCVARRSSRRRASPGPSPSACCGPSSSCRPGSRRSTRASSGRSRAMNCFT